MEQRWERERAQLWAIYFQLRAISATPAMPPFLRRTETELGRYLAVGPDRPPPAGRPHLQLVE